MAALQTHIIAYPLQAWGHARPLINLSARMVKLRPVQVTFLTTNAFFDRIQNELKRSFDEGDDEHAGRIRIVSTGDVPFLRANQGDEHFKKAYQALVLGEELVCAQTNARYSHLPKPQAVIIDLFAIDPFYIIKAISGNTVKVYSWHPGLTSAICYLFGPEKLGGQGNIRIKAEEEARRSGRPYEDIAREMIGTPTGKIVRVPSMPPMYDHEYHPQDFPLPEDVTDIFPRVFEALELMDGGFLFTPESYEPEVVAAVKDWYAETGRAAYVCGPLLPSASKTTAVANEKKQSTESREIQDFLDSTLKSSGEKSLLYIAFGSIFWPVKTPEKLWAFLDVVMELNIPFILSHSSPMASVPDDIKEKVKAYGKAVLSPWSPQQMILDHPATGWFVAHGGHNGVTEAISAGVPQIVWPFSADQPLNAIQIAENLKIGYELIEVRSGHGLKPIYRTGKAPVGTIDSLKAEARDVLAKAFGEDGAKKREKLQVLRKSVTSEWEDGGASKRDITLFLDSL